MDATAYKRMNAAFKGGLGYTGFATLGTVFLAKAWSDELLSPGFGGTPITKQIDLLGDNVFVPDMAMRHGSLRNSGNNAGVPSGSSSRTPENDVNEEGSDVPYNATPWQNWDDDNYQKTYQDSDRGKWYMGCKDKESC